MRTYGLVLVALLGVGCGSKKTPGDLTVTGSPTGEVTGKIHLTIGFSRAMVAHDQLDKPVAAPPVTVSPQLVGEAKWTDDKTLVVWPRADLPVSTRFVATVPRGTRALDGNELGEAFSFEFFTERLTASLDVIGSAERATRDQAIRLGFNHEVPLAQVIEHCRFAAGGKQVPVKNGPESPSGPARSYTIVPAAELALNTAWTVSCAAGLSGSAGNLGLGKAVDQAFHTYGPLSFGRLEPNGDDIVPDENLRLSFVNTSDSRPIR